MQSNDISALADALAKAQGEFPPIVKDKTAKVRMKSGGEYSYSYADLSSVVDGIKTALSKNGVAYSQITCFIDGKFTLVTKLIHKSGQWLDSHWPLPTGLAAQEMGSALTYARRYALTAAVGVATEDDDDGEAATKAHGRDKPKSSQRPTASASAPARNMDAEYRQAVTGRIPDDLDDADMGETPEPPRATNSKGFHLVNPMNPKDITSHDRPSMFLDALWDRMSGEDPVMWWGVNGSLAKEIAEKYPQAREKVAAMEQLAMIRA